MGLNLTLPGMEYPANVMQDAMLQDDNDHEQNLHRTHLENAHLEDAQYNATDANQLVDGQSSHTDFMSQPIKNENVSAHQILGPRITVIGVGGGGGNAVKNMMSAGLKGVTFVVANTDAQALAEINCETSIQLGLELTEGLGAGSKPQVGEQAAESSKEEILAAISDANMVFVTAGMGGGTGTGAAPVIAKIAKEKGILTVAVVTKPFDFEGRLRMSMAEEGVKKLSRYVDTMIVIPNQNLLPLADENTKLTESLARSDDVLYQGVSGITDLMLVPGYINLDFNDIRTAMLEMGNAVLGTGEAEGSDRAERAAISAMENPLLDNVSIKGARSLLINITSSDDVGILEIEKAIGLITKEVHDDAAIIYGQSLRSDMGSRLRISVVAAGIDQDDEYYYNPLLAELEGQQQSNMKNPALQSSSVKPNEQPVPPVNNTNRNTNANARSSQAQQPLRQQMNSSQNDAIQTRNFVSADQRQMNTKPDFLKNTTNTNSTQMMPNSNTNHDFHNRIMQSQQMAQANASQQNNTMQQPQPQQQQMMRSQQQQPLQSQPQQQQMMRPQQQQPLQSQPQQQQMMRPQQQQPLQSQPQQQQMMRPQQQPLQSQHLQQQQPQQMNENRPFASANSTLQSQTPMPQDTRETFNQSLGMGDNNISQDKRQEMESLLDNNINAYNPQPQMYQADNSQPMEREITDSHKKPTLFSKIWGRNKSNNQPARQENHQQQPNITQPSAHNQHARGNTAMVKKVESVSMASPNDPNLDIPAFLRRQAN